MSVLRFAPKEASEILFVFSLVSFLFTPDSLAQNLSKNEIESGIVKVAKLIEDNYVFAQKGKQIAVHLLEEHARGKFDGLKNWQDFGSTATSVLRDFSGDSHLYVRFDPKQVKELLTPTNDVADSTEQNSFFYGDAACEKNYGFAEIRILEGNIGYLKLSEINISEKSLPVLFAAMTFISNTKALVIDLRDNGGGGSEIGPVLESFFLPKDVVLLEFRSRSGSIETSKTIGWLTEKRYDQPMFLIINKKTASAAEAFAYSLQFKKRAKVVGQPSAGAAYMNSWYSVNQFLYVSVSTGAPTLPGTEESWEGKGVQPDFILGPGHEIDFIRRTLIKD